MITVPLALIWILEALASVLVIALTWLTLRISAKSLAQDPENALWLFLNWLSIAFLAFACTHLISYTTRNLIIYFHFHQLALVEGIFGGLDTVTYVVIGAITLFFHRIQRIYLHMEVDHRHLEETSQEILELNREMEALVIERTMKEMALGIAHGIRNPLCIIGGLSHRLIKNPDDAEAIRDQAQAIAEEAKRIEEMVHRFEKLAHKKTSFFAQKDINLLVGSTLDFLRSEFKAKKISLVTELSASPLPGRIDTQLLRIALAHLLRNAVEATQPRGTVLVRTSMDEENVILMIKDTGRGMAPEVVDQVFIPFYTTKLGGTGLGMVFVRQIVNEHRGTIDLESNVGQGTTVTIKIPHRFAELPGVSEDIPAPESPASSGPSSGSPQD
ncbi:MAG: HAMP domain-containing sensor histidine kinase [Syntrophales bacterium]|nr:HAMP domain-containing sensor histidine kinase [Syntrophales bacterium]MDD5640858.1 HAMP domain-containing sensor histidine kinase [Syntrophales bacterium]